MVSMEVDQSVADMRMYLMAQVTYLPRLVSPGGISTVSLKQIQYDRRREGIISCEGWSGNR